MLKAVNIIGLYVDNTADSVSFYRQIGFEIISDDGIIGRVKLGNCQIHFISKDTANDLDTSFKKDAFGEPKGTGVYINIEVSKINEFYKDIIGQGYKPSTEPRNWPWGQREFVLRDPDRYKIVFYEKVKK